jgi:hypothetical protein
MWPWGKVVNSCWNLIYLIDFFGKIICQYKLKNIFSKLLKYLNLQSFELRQNARQLKLESWGKIFENIKLRSCCIDQAKTRLYGILLYGICASRNELKRHTCHAL